MELRYKALQQGIIFRLQMKDEARIKSMKQKDLHIDVLPQDWELYEVWCAPLGVPYCGQGLASLSFQALQHLMKGANQRELLAGEEKCAIFEKYQYRCAECGSRGRLQLDHIVRHSESFGAAPALQPLCESCHLNKTQHESRNLDGTIFGSSFSKEAWDQFCNGA